MDQKPKGIDPRGPRFGAAITSVWLVITVFLGLDTATQDIAAVLLSAITILFAIGAFLGNSRHPYGWVFRKFVKPRLSEPTELEDPRPPQFAQGVGLFVSVVGLVLYIFDVPFGISIAASAAFVAAFLNAAFAYCLGCQLYLGLKRVGIIRNS